MTDKIRIAYTNLADYNEGMLNFRWIDLPMEQKKDGTFKELAKFEKDYPNGEEYFISDYEAPFKIDEYTSHSELETLNEVSELNDYDMKRFSYALDYGGYSEAEALEKYEDVDFYEGMDLKDLAYEFVDEGMFSGLTSESPYVDYDAIARDLGIDYDERAEGVYRMD